MRRLLLSVLCVLAATAVLMAATQDRLPTGDGVTTAWESNGANPNRWEDVDDTIGAPDDATTYLFENDGNDSHLFTFTAFSITSSSIASVTVFGRCQRTAAGDISFLPLIRVNGTTYFDSSHAATTSWADYTTAFTTNPDTAAAWTEADVEGTGANPLQQFGIAPSGFNAGEELQCTQTYLTVTYTAPSGVKQLTMIGVG